ncbi:MAG: hypothetical protein ACREM3_17515 [Candidatus Rokuibacteriota bacterium]
MQASSAVVDRFVALLVGGAESDIPSVATARRMIGTPPLAREFLGGP